MLSDVASTVVAALEKNTCVQDIAVSTGPAADAGAIAAWESRHGFSLPRDLASLLAMSNGLTVSWKIAHCGQAVPLGRVHVNSLADMTPVPCNDFAEARGPFCVSPAEATAGVHVAGFAGRAFAVDRTPSGAHVALCYGDDASAAPQIWFRDTAFWHFIASTYADYFRLELAHYGIPNWQYVFSPIGLDPIAKHWFRLVAPARLALDMERSAARPRRADPAQVPAVAEPKAARRRGGRARHAARLARAPPLELVHLEMLRRSRTVSSKPAPG